MTYDVTLIPGDGIGPEITAQTVKVLEATGLRFNWDEELAGMARRRRHRHPAARRHRREHPQEHRSPSRVRSPRPVGTGFRSVNVGLRKEFELFANVRPAKSIIPGGRFENVDIVLVRENLEGLYIGVEHFVQIGDDPRAVASPWPSSPGGAASGSCATPSSTPCEHGPAQGHHRAQGEHPQDGERPLPRGGPAVAEEYAGRVESNDMIVDNTAMQLVMRPEQFDVMVTTNMFGDILSDEVSGLVGGLGLAPGANIGTEAAIFEAVHGSAPDIAGKGVANPSAQMLAAAMMLDHLGELDRAERIRRAVIDTIVTRRDPHPRPRRHGIHRGVRRVLSRGGLPEVPCARCGDRVVGSRLGRALPATAARSGPGVHPAGHPHLPGRDGADGSCTSHSPCPRIRWLGSTGRSPSLATYIIVRRIASRVAMEIS